MKRKSILASAAVAAALIAAVGTTAASHDDDHDGHDSRRSRRFTADLKGLQEVPVVATSGRGLFRAMINPDETEITYRLDYSGLEGTVTMAHIHVGEHHTSGGISVWLCQTSAQRPPASQSGTPTCGAPGGPDAEAQGVLTAANIVGPSSQGIGEPAPPSPLPPRDPDVEFAQLIKMIRSGLAYANVHSTMSPGGEIRGQIRVDD